MSKFYFHTDAEKRVTDEVGVELPDLESARVSAIHSAADMLHDSARKFWGTKPWTMTVTDERGLILFTIELHGQDSPACTKLPT